MQAIYRFIFLKNFNHCDSVALLNHYRGNTDSTNGVFMGAGLSVSLTNGRWGECAWPVLKSVIIFATPFHGASLRCLINWKVPKIPVIPAKLDAFRQTAQLRLIKDVFFQQSNCTEIIHFNKWRVGSCFSLNSLVNIYRFLCLCTMCV